MDISVIIPCYNSADSLERAVASVEAQENVEKEIIIVDDGSDVPVQSVMKSSDYRVLRIPHSGVSAARNKGLEEAQGEFVTFLDADDFLVETENAVNGVSHATGATANNLYHDIIEFMREKEYDIVSGDYIRQDLSTGEKTVVRSLLEGQVRLENIDTDFTAFFTPGSFCYVWNKIYQKSFLEKHDLKYDAIRFAEDRDFNSRCLLCGASAYFTDRIFAEYHFRPDVGRVAPDAIFDGFLRQSQVFREMSEERDYCRAYAYQAAYTCAFGLFFAAAGLPKSEKRTVIDKALSDDFFMEEMKVLTRYPRGAQTKRGMRWGVLITAVLLRMRAAGFVAWIFTFAEKKGLSRKNSPSGLMNENK